MEMEDRWDRLEAWLEVNTGPDDPDLAFGPPATEAAIDEAEAEIGLSFPPSVREAYRVHDGTERPEYVFFGVWKLYPLETVVSKADSMAEIGEQFGRDCWDARAAIPILHRFNGDLAYVEHAPDGEETPVVMWNHETHEHTEAAPSFAAFFDDLLDAIGAGECEIDGKDWGGFSMSCADAPTPWNA